MATTSKLGDRNHAMELRTPGDHSNAMVEGHPVGALTQTQVVGPLDLTRARQMKLASAAFCFFNAGVNDGALGAIIPYILRSYSISTSWVAIIYGAAFFGWLLAAVLGGYFRMMLGTGGVIIAGAGLQMLAQILRFWSPPFGLFSVTFFIMALGQALQEPQANTFVAGLKSAHRWLGLIHGCYAIGGLVGPLVAAVIGSNFPSKWAYFYFVPMGIGAVNLAVCGYAFRDETSLYQRNVRVAAHGEPPRPATALVELKATLKQKPVWLLSIFFFLYLGAAITAGGWVVEFLVVVRKGQVRSMGGHVGVKACTDPYNHRFVAFARGLHFQRVLR